MSGTVMWTESPALATVPLRGALRCCCEVGARREQGSGPEGGLWGEERHKDEEGELKVLGEGTQEGRSPAKADSRLSAKLVCPRAARNSNRHLPAISGATRQLLNVRLPLTQGSLC